MLGVGAGMQQMQAVALGAFLAFTDGPLFAKQVVLFHSKLVCRHIHIDMHMYTCKSRQVGWIEENRLGQRTSVRALENAA